jgi:hypothetical protein
MQKIEDTGPLTCKRMETFAQEVTNERVKYLTAWARATSPFSYCSIPRRSHLVALAEQVYPEGGG